VATAKKSTAKTVTPAKPAKASIAVAKKTVAPVTKPATKPAAPAKAAPAKVGNTKPAAAKSAAKPIAKPAAKPAPAPANTAIKPAVKTAAAKPTPAKAAPAKPAAVKSPAPTIKHTASQAVEKKTMPEKASKPQAAPPAAKKSTAAKAKKVVPDVLTDAEIQKMSEDDYMNEAQLNFFKVRLQTMKDEILVNARETGEHLKENEVFADPNDRATVEEENMLEQRVRDRERKLLKKIDQSLARIESGDYGYCLETGDPIGIPRLLARPTAELCIEAQEKHEQRERLFAD
jgi:DnaK suppressor protein